MIFSGKQKLMKSTEAESPLKSLSKIWKKEVKNPRNIVARTVSRLARSSNESAGRKSKKGSRTS